MNKIKRARVQLEYQTWTLYIDLGADAINIDMKNKEILQAELGNIKNK